MYSSPKRSDENFGISRSLVLQRAEVEVNGTQSPRSSSNGKYKPDLEVANEVHSNPFAQRFACLFYLPV
jgi:hypothetical protein